MPVEIKIKYRSLGYETFMAENLFTTYYDCELIYKLYTRYTICYYVRKGGMNFSTKLQRNMINEQNLSVSLLTDIFR